MNGRTRVGVIGCGFFAQFHLHSWKGLAEQGADLVAVCDVDPAKAKAAAGTFGAPHSYVDAETMLREEKLDLVDIATRMDTHRPLVEQAIGRGVATIVQKPFGVDLADCIAMAEAASRAGVFLAVHENFRYQAPMRRVQEVLRSGGIGTPSWGRITFRTGYDVYLRQPYLRNEERFIVIDLGVHMLDLARVFLGEVEHLAAETQRRNPDVRGEDTATMLLKHRGGAVSVVECTYDAHRLPDPFPETFIEIEGPKGSIVLGPGLSLNVTVDGRSTVTDADAPLLPWAERPWHVVQESVYATCADILAAFRDGRPADTSAHDNLKTYALCEAVYDSARSARVVHPRQTDAIGLPAARTTGAARDASERRS